MQLIIHLGVGGICSLLICIKKGLTVDWKSLHQFLIEPNTPRSALALLITSPTSNVQRTDRQTTWGWFVLLCLLLRGNYETQWPRVHAPSVYLCSISTDDCNPTSADRLLLFLLPSSSSSSPTYLLNSNPNSSPYQVGKQARQI